VQILARVMVCRTRYSETFMFITANWTLEQAKRYAAQLGHVPLYIVNVKKGEQHG
jgi:hypothetical protein